MSVRSSKLGWVTRLLYILLHLFVFQKKKKSIVPVVTQIYKTVPTRLSTEPHLTNMVGINTS